MHLASGRAALALLFRYGIPWHESLPCVRSLTVVQRGLLLKQLESKVHSVSTSSMGRLFDAIASLVGVRQAIHFEGQAAMELEYLSRATHGRAHIRIPTRIDGTRWRLATRLRGIAKGCGRRRAGRKGSERDRREVSSDDCGGERRHLRKSPGGTGDPCHWIDRWSLSECTTDTTVATSTGVARIPSTLSSLGSTERRRDCTRPGSYRSASFAA